MQKYQYHGLQSAIHGVTESSKLWLKGYIQELLEKNIHFTQKADLLAYGITSVEDQIKAIDEQMNDLKQYKAPLKQSIEIAKEVGATVFTEMGISKLEGSSVSSLTVTRGTSSSKLQVHIPYESDEDALIEAGYYLKVLDEKRIIQEYMTGSVEQKELLKEFCTFTLVTKENPSKLRINKRKAVNNIQPSSDDLIDDAA